MSNRVLILSWEYPPVIEGGLARHVRKLAEALVRQGVSVDVLTRGGRLRAGDRPLRASRSSGGVTRVIACASPAGRATSIGSSHGWSR